MTTVISKYRKRSLSILTILFLISITFFPASLFAVDDYKFVGKWGSSGSGDGQLYRPRGIAISQTGDIYVADYGNYRMQKFDANGNFILKWGSRGPGDGQFFGDHSVAVDSSGFVYVSDYGNYRIQKFDANGNFIAKWGSSGSGDGQFNWPQGVAVDSQNNVYVCDRDNNRIQKFDANGNFIAKWGSLGSGDGQFNMPEGIAVDSANNLYVTDANNSRVQKFDSNGNFITKWGSYGWSNGQFFTPYGINVDNQNNVYVVSNGTWPDSAGARVQKFNSNGNFIASWGSGGRNDGQFFWPEGIAVDGSGVVHVVDMYNDRIQKFADFGAPITTLSVNISPNANDWYTTIPEITLSSDEAGTTYYAWDSTSSFNTYLSPISALEGTHTLYYYSVDAVGNQETTKSKVFKVDTQAPVPQLYAPPLSTNQSKTESFIVSWMATDASSSVASYDVQYKDASLGLWTDLLLDTNKTSTVFTGEQGHTYYFRIRAKDAAGNISDWSAEKFSVVPYDDIYSGLTYTGNWSSIVDQTASFFKDTLHYSTTASDSLTFTFTGKSIVLITTKGPDRGQADVYIDGIKLATIDTYSPIIQYRVPFVKRAAEVGTHTITIVNLATSGRPRLDIDAMGVEK